MGESVTVVIEALLKSEQFKAGMKAAAKEVAETGKQVKKTQGFLEEMKGAWLGAIAGIMAAIGILKKGFDLASEFADFEEQAIAMEKQFGVNSNAVIKKLQEVSGGALSMRDAVLTANKAMAFGVTRDVDKIAKIYEIARARGDALGIDGKEAFESLVTGIGKETPRLLKTIGISVSGWDELAKSQGRTVDKAFILEQVLKQGDSILAKTAGSAETLADKLERAQARMDDLRLITGKYLAENFGGLIASIDFGELEGGMIGLRKAIEAVALVAASALLTIRFLANTFQIFSAPITEFIKMIGKAIEDIKNGNFSALAAIKDFAGGIKGSVKTDLKDIGDAFKAFGTQGAKLFDFSDSPVIQESGVATGEAFVEGVVQGIENKKEDVKKVVKQRAEDVADFEAEVAALATDKANEYLKLQGEEKLLDDIDRLKRFEEYYAENQEMLAQITSARIEAEAELEAKRENDRLNYFERSLEKAKQTADLVFGFFASMSNARASVMERQMNEELKNFKGTSEEKVKIEEAWQKKIAKVKRRAAVAEKGAAIFSATVNAIAGAARAFKDYMFPLSVVMAALAGAAGGAQVAAIAAKPIPEFAMGGRPDGLSLVGERGPELFVPDSPGRIIPNNMLRGISIPGGRGGSVVNDNSAVTNSNDNSTKHFHFHGIQDLGDARNALMRREGKGAFA